MSVQRKCLRRYMSMWLMPAVMWASGCASPSATIFVTQKAELKRGAWECLRLGVRYQANPGVRAQAVEALRHSATDDALPWIRSSLMDEHPAVRFAACMAVGELVDKGAKRAVTDLLHDPDANVRVSAIFALYKFGDASHTAELTRYLLQDADPLVRRNAAMVLGRLQERSAVKPLAQAMNDSDSGVRNYALEAMALLGNRQATQELAFMANTGVGAEEVFAVQALAQVGSPHFVDLFQYKLANSVHIETRLAAAKGLGLLGLMDGFDLALQALRPGAARKYESSDSPQEQQLRRWLLATSALGIMGQEAALSDLAHLMKASHDPRVQVSTAQAILQILKSLESSATNAAVLFRQ